MANNATTDEILMTAYQATKKHWGAFILLPFIAGSIYFIFFGIVAVVIIGMNGATAVMALLTLLTLFLMATYLGAQMKWCEEIYNKKEIDIQEGLKYGLSRAPGIMGTGFLTLLKVFLWGFALIAPAFYKGFMYSQSIHVSALEKISGSDANRISEAMLKKVGPVRGFSNIIGVFTLAGLAVYMVFFIFAGPFFLSSLTESMVLIAIIGFIGMITYIVVGVFGSIVSYNFIHFQYLYFRDEAKTEINKVKKALS